MSGPLELYQIEKTLPVPMRLFTFKDHCDWAPRESTYVVIQAHNREEAQQILNTNIYYSHLYRLDLIEDIPAQPAIIFSTAD